jgi:hypothetical protein
MIEEIRKIIEIFLDKSKHWTLRAGIFISILGFLFIVDFSLNLSYNYHLSNKLEHLEKINSLKKVYEKDSLKFKNIVELENRIICKKHYSDYLLNLDFSDNFSFKDSRKSITTKINEQKPKNNTTAKNITNKKNIPSYHWMLISSNYFFLIVFVILIFVPLFGKEQRTLKSLTGWFAGLISFALIIFIVTWIAFKIPIINNNPIYNYILNALIHTVFIAVIVKNSDKK